MPTLYVENVPEDLYEALRARARERRTSISAEVLSLLEKDVPTAKELARRQEFMARILEIAARPSPKPGPHPSMVANMDFGVEGNQGEVKFFQPLVLFGDDQEVFPDLGEKAGGSDLGTDEGVAFAHGVKVGELAARGAMCVFPINFSGTKSNPLNHNTLCPTHDRSIVFDAKGASGYRQPNPTRLSTISAACKAYL